MISVSSLVSTRLRDALIARADDLLDTMDPSQYNNPRRVVQFMRNSKHSHRLLLEKCNKYILRNIPVMDAENIGIVVGLYQSLQFNNCDFRLAVKHRLTELIDSSTAPFTFTKLFVALAPLASQDVRERFVPLLSTSGRGNFSVSQLQKWLCFIFLCRRLESTALLLADELNAQQALAVADTLEEINSRNHSLLNK